MKRIIATLILSAMIVSSVAPFFGAKEYFETDSITVQDALIMEIPVDNMFRIVNIEIEEEKSELEIAIENMNADMKAIENIDDKKEWFISYKKIIDKYSYILDPPETIYDYFSEQELDLLFKVVQAEIGDYSFEQKINVANVVYNRVYHERFGETLSEVLIPSQFATISNGRINRVKVDEDTILACEYAFLFEDTTNGALFFDSDGSLKYPKIYDDEAHNFYTLKEEINKDE